MKKFLLTLVGIVCSLGMWADAVTIGLTQAVDNTAKTVGDPVYTGTDHVTVAAAIGSKCSANQTGKTSKVGSYSISKAFRKTSTLTKYDSDTWMGYTMTVATGYKVSMSNIKATLWDCSDTDFTWSVVVEDASGTALYTSKDAKSNKSANGSVEVAAPTDVSDLSAGTYKVKIRLWQNGGNKYFAVPYLTVDADVTVDESKTYNVTTSVSPANSGTVTGGGTWKEGTNVKLTATPATGYKFVNWTVDDGTVTDNPYTISSIAANHTIVANFSALKKITYALGEGTGICPSVDYADVNEKIKLPSAQAQLIYKDGCTMTGWSDGTTTYAKGAEYTVTDDVTLTAQFAANEVALGTATATVNWTFATKDGAPSAGLEGKIGYYAAQTTVNDIKLDVIMKINTVAKAAGESYTDKGKWNTTGADNRAQVNKGTVFTIPAMKGMTVTYTATNGTITDEAATFAGGKGTVDSKANTLTYTYNGDAITIDIVDEGKNVYPSGIKVKYPIQTINSVVDATVGYATFFSNQERVIPADTKAYTGKLNGSKLTLTQLEGSVIPAKTAVVLCGKGGDFVIGTTGASSSGDNDLKGTVAETDTPENSYVLGRQNDVTAFYRYTGTKIPAYKAYLVIASEAKAVTIAFDDATVVAGVAEAQDAPAVIKTANYIIKNGVKYNYAGQLVK